MSYTTAYLALGSNVGDKLNNIQTAVAEILRIPAKIIEMSHIFETEPVGIKDQPMFLNCCIEIETELAPMELLEKCLEIERKLGRVRREKNGPREIDVDILFYGDKILDEPGLKIPHPEIRNRKFVLVPLAEIAPDFADPVTKKTVSQMLKECGDTAIVKPHGNIRAKKTGE